MKVILDNTIVSSSGCWIWQKSCASPGYGQFTRGGKYHSAHRYAWEVVNGKIPKGNVIRHMCHTPACCNPDHLKAGTHKDNYHDSLDKHNAANKKLRKDWEILGIRYPTVRSAVVATGISPVTICKYTCKKTRVFDVDSYRSAAKIAGWAPRV